MKTMQHNDFEPAEKEQPLDAFLRYRQLEDAVRAEITEKPGSTAVVAINLDNLKQLNEEYGHDEGSRFLLNVREVLNVSVRQREDARNTIIATGQAIYTSGDEYWIMLRDVSNQSEVDAFIKHTQSVLDDLGVAASMGGRVNIPGETARELLRSTDALMYKNKLARVPVLDPEAENAFLDAVQTIEELGVSLRAAAIYRDAIRQRLELATWHKPDL